MQRFMNNAEMNKKMRISAAKTIQAAWRRYAKKIQKRMEEYENDYDDNYFFIPCSMCGADCYDGDYPMWRFCSRSCMVYASRGDRW